MKNGQRLGRLMPPYLALALGLFLLVPAALPPAAAAPVLVPDAPVMRLDEIGLYEVGYAYRGRPEVQFPLGWSGFFEEQTGVACQPAGLQNGLAAFLLHCPWRHGTGIAFQQFTFQLPPARGILLRGATALRADAVGKSDGATFRVFVGGKKLLDVNRTDAAWLPFSFDLTDLAGQTVTIRFETDPGPRDNPSFDFSLWGERDLVLTGAALAPASHPAPAPIPLAALTSRPAQGVAPPSATAGSVTVALQGDLAVLRYAGADGTLEYRWQRPGTAPGPLFGALTLHATMTGDREVTLPVAAGARAEWTQPVTPLASAWETAPDRITCLRTFQAGATTVTLRLTARLIGKSLALEITADQPLISALDAGDFGPVLHRRQLPVPYYSGQVFFLAAENLFANAFLDWTDSTASAHDHTLATYGALTDGRRNLLHERALYTASWQFPETLPNIPNPPSPYLDQLGDKIVLDTWGGSFAEITQSLEQLADYGLAPAVVLVHVWQHYGYDNGLPQHYPAQAALGGEPGMAALTATARRLGFVLALHENFVDYYPNYDHFDPTDLALTATGEQVKAWYNPGTKIQSFAVKPTAMLRLAAEQSPEINRRYGTDACFLDVCSAVRPWFHVDARATEPGAGTFRATWDAHRALWAYERGVFHGPVFGEGANHWYWSGYLDGVEAQFGAGWTAAGTSAPLFVDFDLLKIHPLQGNHGMGYYERWWEKPDWGGLPPMLVLDQYRMQEVAYGHAGFLGAATWNQLPLAWLEHNLLVPVTARYATAKVQAIAYEHDGAWVDSTAAARAGAWDRVRVTYDNGLVIVANNRPEPLAVSGYTLPQYGWLAQGAGVTAYTASRDGQVVDFAETADRLFANARSAPDWGPRTAQPTVAAFTPAGDRTFRVTYNWQVNGPLAANYHAFVHFTQPGADQQEGIRFQQDHPLTPPTTQWAAGQTVADGPYTVTLPAGAADGDYAWLIGLFSPAGGGRVAIQGTGDGRGRIRLGVLSVRDDGKTLTFTPQPPAADPRFLAHLNPGAPLVDFGPVRTDGSLELRRVGTEWVLQTYPRDRAFTVQLSVRRFPPPAQVRSAAGAGPPSVGPQWWTFPLTGAREYRWTAGPAPTG
jgi:hypothetical protein